MGAYADAYRASLTDPEAFWGGQAGGVEWGAPARVVLDRSDEPFYRWFSGGLLNTSFNALDRHVVAGRGEQPALSTRAP